jgi:hypothetical protein
MPVTCIIGETYNSEESLHVVSVPVLPVTHLAVQAIGSSSLNHEHMYGTLTYKLGLSIADPFLETHSYAKTGTSCE